MPCAVANGLAKADDGTVKILTVPPLAALLASAAFAQDAPIDWRTIAAEFSQDQAAAETKYAGKMITVTGPVSSLAEGDMTTETAPAVAVILSTQDGPGPDVKCLFESEDLEPNTQLDVTDDGGEVLIRTVDQVGNETGSRPFIQSGQQITVSGPFFEFDAGDIVLRHCRLTGGAPAP